MELTLYTLRTVAYAIVDPSHLLVLVLLGVIFYQKNRRISIMQKITIGESLNSPLELTLSQLVIGIIAGAIISVILSNIGIAFNYNWVIEILFIASLITLFIKKRFIGFAYIGAGIGFVSMLLDLISSYTDLRINFKIDIITLMTLIGIMYIMEGILIAIDGKRGAIPVFSNRENNIIGGFAYNRSWPLPIAILFIVAGANTSSMGVTNISMPDWWPIINRGSTLALLATAVLASAPMYGILNYTAVTFTREKGKKPVYSGVRTLIYGISVVLVAQLGRVGVVGNLISIIYVPLVYEAIIKIDKILEKKSKCLYISDNEGVCVLEVAPTSPAYEAGIRRGDKIIQVNDKEISLEVDVFKAIRESVFGVHIKVKKVSGEIKDYEIRAKGKRIGILLVPKIVKIEDALDFNGDEIKKILEEIKKK